LPAYFLKFISVFWVGEKSIGVDLVTLIYTMIEPFEEALLSHLR